MSKPVDNSNDGAPASIHTEVAVLGAMLLDEDAIHDAMERLQAEDFSLDSHRKVFNVILDLAETGNPVDYTTVRVELERKRELDSIGGPAYLAYLSEGIPRNINIQSYCRIVKDKSLLRQAMGIFHDGGVRAADQSEDALTVISEVEGLLLELTQEDQIQRGFSTLLDAVKDAGGLDAYFERLTDPAEMTGLATGLTDLDALLGGLKKKEFIVIAARPSAGKTALGLCIAANIVIADVQAIVAVFSLEMSRDALFQRLLASQSTTNLRKAQEGFLSSEARARLKSALIRMCDRQLLIDDTPSIPLTKMRARCLRLKKKNGRLDVVVIDYLQLMKGGKKYQTRELEVTAISQGLHALAKELDCPIVALAQLGRGSEQRGGDKRPILSDLRESGSIEQDADCVVFIHRAEMYASADDETVERGIAELIVAKNRTGPVGTRRVVYLAEYTRFDNLAKQEEIPYADQRTPY